MENTMPFKSKPWKLHIITSVTLGLIDKRWFSVEGDYTGQDTKKQGTMGAIKCSFPGLCPKSLAQHFVHSMCSKFNV